MVSSHETADTVCVRGCVAADRGPVGEGGARDGGAAPVDLGRRPSATAVAMRWDILDARGNSDAVTTLVELPGDPPG